MTLLAFAKRVFLSQPFTKKRSSEYVRIVIEVPVTSITSGYLSKKSFMKHVNRALTKGLDSIFRKTYRV